MQAYTLKKQGSEISAAASILVMYFILYQVALIILDLIRLKEKTLLMSTYERLQKCVFAFKYQKHVSPEIYFFLHIRICRIWCIEKVVIMQAKSDTPHMKKTPYTRTPCSPLGSWKVDIVEVLALS